jgi:hypothetical protein
VLFSGADALVLIDPLVPDDLWPDLDAEVEQSGKAVVVLTTIYFHERSRADVAQRYEARLGGDVTGVRPFSAERGDEVVLWLEQPRALVAGDALLGDQQGGLLLTPWSKDDAGRERTRVALQQMLDLPIEVVLPSHGEPVLANGREALARALEP